MGVAAVMVRWHGTAVTCSCRRGHLKEVLEVHVPLGRVRLLVWGHGKNGGPANGGRVGSETWDTVVRKEEKGWSERTGGKESQITGGGALWDEVLGGCGLEEGLSTSDREGL